jgi:multiple sugar transport system substrate-binding protein
MKLMRRMAVALVLMAGFLTGGFLMPGAARADITVLGWPGGPEEAGLRALAKAWNAAHAENQVKLIFYNRDNFWDKLQTDLAAGSAGFDLNLTATYSIGRYAPYMDPITLPTPAHSVFPDSVLSTMQYGGKQYGLPTDLSLHYLYYRRDLIERLLSDPAWQKIYTDIAQKKLGKALAPKPPAEWSWDDYQATALFFTRAINPHSPVRYGTVLQMKNLLFNIMVWQCVPRSFGGMWLDSAGHVAVDSAAYRTALTLYKAMYDEGTTPSDSLSYEYPEANAAFGSGQVATMLQWNAALADLDDAAKTPAVSGKIGVVPPPAGPDGHFTHIHSLGFGLNKASTHKQQAMQFLDWLATPEAMVLYAKAGGSPALQPEIAKQVAQARPDLLRLGAFAAQYGFVMPGGTTAHALQIYDLQAREFTGFWGGTESLDTALSKTAAGMKSLLAQ